MKKLFVVFAAIALLGACSKKQAAQTGQEAPKAPSKILVDPKNPQAGVKSVPRESLFSMSIGGSALSTLRAVANPSQIQSQFVQYTDGENIYELVDFGVGGAGDTTLIATPFLTLDYKLKSSSTWELIVVQEGRTIPSVAVGSFTMNSSKDLVIMELCSGDYASACSLVKKDGGTFGINISVWADPFAG